MHTTRPSPLTFISILSLLLNVNVNVNAKPSATPTPLNLCTYNNAGIATGTTCTSDYQCPSITVYDGNSETLTCGASGAQCYSSAQATTVSNHNTKRGDATTITYPCSTGFTCGPTSTQSMVLFPAGVTGSTTTSKSATAECVTSTAGNNFLANKRDRQNLMGVLVCEKGEVECPFSSRFGSGTECVDVTKELEQCGGCFHTGQGQDCTRIPNAFGVGCEEGVCQVYSCLEGFEITRDRKSCVGHLMPTMPPTLNTANHRVRRHR